MSTSEEITDQRRTPDGLTESEYREHVRAWLAAKVEPAVDAEPFSVIHWMRSPEEEAAQHERWCDLQARLHEGGFVGITVPAEYGGQGGEPWMEQIYAEESAGWAVNTGFFKSLVGMAAPAMLMFGTEEQKLAHLPTMLTGTTGWCQLFSEPGAGSDLAGLACRAELDGDEWVVNGQKVWNSSAAHADKGLLLARTRPEAPKHKGITFLLIDMHADGVEVRPLVQAHGASDFCEVFLQDVRVPVDAVLGEVDQGWGPARMVMAGESTIIGGGGVDRFHELSLMARDRGRLDDPVIRQDLARAYTRQHLLGWMANRLMDAARSGDPLPFDPSVVKLFVAQNWREHGDLASRLLGPACAADTHPGSAWGMELTHLRYAISIGGGTDEVHRNNVGERALGLPHGPRPGKDTPWFEVPRN